jgi:hypothetical protein
MPLLTFDQAIDDSGQYSKRHLMLGNGFSIACSPDIFHYASLYGEADFSAIPEAEQVFETLGTQDFEIAIHALENGAKLLPIYAPTYVDAAAVMLAHAAALKEILLTTIAHNHPDRPGSIADARFLACRQFLSHFVGAGDSGQVYTLNYDLLLYWALMHEDVPEGTELIELEKNDGFGNDEDDPDADYVVWQGETSANRQRVHYLHGALHLFDSGAELKKYTWVRQGDPLIVQARAAINANAYPLFVAEGQSEQKKNKIRHNAYLYHSFKSLVSNAQQSKPSFFIFGHSLAENDDHILSRLGRGRFPALYVGVFGDPNSVANQQIMHRANSLAALRNERHPLQIKYFDSANRYRLPPSGSANPTRSPSGPRM